jgi:hypothetical protein
MQRPSVFFGDYTFLGFDGSFYIKLAPLLSGTTAKKFTAGAIQGSAIFADQFIG